MLFRLFPDNIDVLIILIPILMFALSFHEFAHAFVAYLSGDDTAQKEGRLTLNPFAHLDMVGSLMILFVGFGWAKPVPVNPLKLKNKDASLIKIALAGPLSNLFLALLAGMFVRYLNFFEINISESITMSVYFFLYINIALAIFNLIPVAPLDGSQIFDTILNKKNPNLAWKLRVNGPKVLLAIILFGIISGFSIISLIITPFIKIFMYIFAGISI